MEAKMTDRNHDPADARFPAPMGSLERTIDDDDALAGLPDDRGGAAAETPDQEEHWELDRMIIRLGGNGF